jgi:hypothetical protein
MLHVLINLFGEMLQELIHLFAFMLHNAFSDVGCFIICYFEFMITQIAPFRYLLFANNYSSFTEASYFFWANKLTFIRTAYSHKAENPAKGARKYHCLKDLLGSAR